MLINVGLIGASGVSHNIPTVYKIWSANPVPQYPDYGETSYSTVGVRFKSSVSGYVMGIRFYKATTNTGTHVGVLWTNTGTELARATFANETSSGWQEVIFASPVAITADTVYVSSYYTPTGHFSSDEQLLMNSGVSSPPLYALQDYEGSNRNGIYIVSSQNQAEFPTDAYEGNGYGVDVLFQTELA